MALNEEIKSHFVWLRLTEPRAQVIVDELVFHRDAGCMEARAKQQNQTDDVKTLTKKKVLLISAQVDVSGLVESYPTPSAAV